MITGLLFETIRRVCLISIHATGKVRVVSLCIGVLLTLNPFIVYIVFRLIPVVSLAYVSNVFINMILALIIMLLVKKQIPEFSLRRLIVCVLKMLAVIFIAMMVVYLSVRSLPANLVRVLISAVMSTVLLSAGTYFFCLDKSKRQWVVSFIKNKFKRTR